AYYYIPARIGLIHIKWEQLESGNFTQTQVQNLESEYTALLDEFGKGLTTSFAIRQLAQLRATYLQNTEQAIEELELLLKNERLPADMAAAIKLELGDIYILDGNVWEAALLFGQVEKDFPSESYGQEARYKNARLAYFKGDFTWAQAQLDI